MDYGRWTMDDWRWTIDDGLFIPVVVMSHESNLTFCTKFRCIMRSENRSLLWPFSVRFVSVLHYIIQNSLRIRKVISLSRLIWRRNERKSENRRWHDAVMMLWFAGCLDLFSVETDECSSMMCSKNYVRFVRSFASLRILEEAFHLRWTNEYPCWRVVT